MTKRATRTHDGPAVDVQRLVKTFRARGGGTLRAVDGISFSVRRGEVFGFLGPNGAGKTTTLEIVEGLQSPTSGRALVLGLDSQRDRTAVKQRIGIQLQAGAYFDYLTLEEILDLFGSFYPTHLEPMELLERVGLGAKRKVFVRHLSGGQAQRFSIVAAMVNDPEVLFLDEPTTGLDPAARRSLWKLVREVNEVDGKTIVLTTHYMDEAEALCHRVAIMDAGAIRALDTPLNLVHRLPTADRIRFSTAGEIEAGPLKALPGVVDVSATPAREGRITYELAVTRAQAALPGFVAWSERGAAQVDDIRVVPATLEEVFLSLTGHGLGD